MQKIVLDTNFLLIPFTLKVDIFQGIKLIMDDRYELYIIDKTIDELNIILNTKKGKTKQAAKFALELVKKNKLKKLKSKTDYVDEAILGLDKDYIVATQDKLLKQKLKKQARKLIVLRQKSHLILI
jgi:rRNA-processing protein FCF1